jgi:hypothetical protein
MYSFVISTFIHSSPSKSPHITLSLITSSHITSSHITSSHPLRSPSSSLPRSFFFISTIITTSATPKYFVPDVSTRRFLLANRQSDGADFENRLMFALSFGTAARFGIQTHHLYDHFSSSNSRFDRKNAQRIVADIQKFMMDKRISKFTREENKHARKSVEHEYDVQKLDDDPRTAAMRGLGFIDDDYEDDAVTENEKMAAAREVETMLKMTVLYNEVEKIKHIAARTYPVQAKEYGLAEKLMDPLFVPK